jgi:hypothetical protein
MGVGAGAGALLLVSELTTAAFWTVRGAGATACVDCTGVGFTTLGVAAVVLTGAGVVVVGLGATVIVCAAGCTSRT